MNSQRFRAAAFITQTWLKWWTPQASRGLMILLCLLSFTSAEGMPLNSSLGCLHAPNEGSLTTSYSRFLCSYSAQSHGKWKRLTPPPPMLLFTPPTDGSTHSTEDDDVHLCVCVCDKLTCVTGHSLVPVKLPSTEAVFSPIGILLRLVVFVFAYF